MCIDGWFSKTKSHIYVVLLRGHNVNTHMSHINTEVLHCHDGCSH